MYFLRSEYRTNRSQIIISINKQLNLDITTFNEILDILEYYKSKRGENFIIFKNFNLIIFQSLFQAKQYNKDIFARGTFYIALKFKAKNNANNFNNNIVIMPINFHYDFEKDISNLLLINSDYIFDIYIKIKSVCQKNNYGNFLEFLE
ncbi:hypothetical protein U3516DRAFT_857607 [Neocallimastix sp. 'constans']